MANLPILNAVEPTVIPAKTYDRVWVEEIVIRGADPNKDIVGEVKLRKYGVFEGIAELEPSNGSWIRIDNMLAKGDNDPDLQTAITALLAYINKLGIANNIISS